MVKISYRGVIYGPPCIFSVFCCSLTIVTLQRIRYLEKENKTLDLTSFSLHSLARDFVNGFLTSSVLIHLATTVITH